MTKEDILIELNDCSKESEQISRDLQLAVRSFFVQLQKTSTFANNIPEIILHRKLSLNNLIKNTLSGIDNMLYELKRINFDCNMQASNIKRSIEFENKFEPQASAVVNDIISRLRFSQGDNDEE